MQMKTPILLLVTLMATFTWPCFAVEPNAPPPVEIAAAPDDGAATLVSAFFGTSDPGAAARLRAHGQYHEAHVVWAEHEPPVKCFQLVTHGPGRTMCVGIVQWCHMHRLMGEPVDSHVLCKPPGEAIAYSPD